MNTPYKKILTTSVIMQKALNGTLGNQSGIAVYDSEMTPQSRVWAVFCSARCFTTPCAYN